MIGGGGDGNGMPGGAGGGSGCTWFGTLHVSEDDVYWVDPTCYLRVGGRTLLFFRMELKDIGLLDTRQIWLDTSPDKRMEDATGFWAGGPPTVKQAGGAVAPASAAEMEHVGGCCACAAERRRSLKM